MHARTLALFLLLATASKASAATTECYGDKSDIYDGFDRLAASEPGLVERFLLGASVDGQPIYAWRVARRSNNELFGNDSGILVMTGGVHGDERRPPETLYRFAWLLVNNYERDPLITWVVDTTEIWFVPIVNPDGFDIGWRLNRLDRDIARNFPYAWDIGERNAGPWAASEPETQALVQLLDQVAPVRDGEWVSPNQRGLYIDVHGSISATFHAYSSTTAVPHCELPWINSHFARLNDTRALPNAHMDRASRCELPDPYFGSPVDYAYGARGIPAFTFELRSETIACTTQPTDRFRDCEREAAALYEENIEAWLLAAQLSAFPYIRADGAFYQAGTIRMTRGRVEARFATFDTRAEHPPSGCDHRREEIVSASLTIYDRSSSGTWAPRFGCVNHPMVAKDGAFDSGDEVAIGYLPTSCAAPGGYVVLQARTKNYFGPEAVFSR
ncbi:MAG: M14 family zinc carboxypeptidase [Deltaproteobacteria bacterium]